MQNVRGIEFPFFDFKSSPRCHCWISKNGFLHKYNPAIIDRRWQPFDKPGETLCFHIENVTCDIFYSMKCSVGIISCEGVFCDDWQWLDVNQCQILCWFCEMNLQYHNIQKHRKRAQSYWKTIWQFIVWLLRSPTVHHQKAHRLRRLSGSLAWPPMFPHVIILTPDRDATRTTFWTSQSCDAAQPSVGYICNNAVYMSNTGKFFVDFVKWAYSITTSKNMVKSA